MFGRGETPEITITVRDEGKTLVPGDTVHATVTFGASKPIKARSIRAGLVLLRKSQEVDVSRDSDGDRRKTTVWQTHEKWVETAQVDPDSAGQAPLEFEWPVPSDAPPTYGGEITNNRWVVKVTVDRKLANDVNEEIEVVVATPLPAGAEEGVPVVCNAVHSDATLRLELPRAAYAEGERISGHVALTPSNGLKARGLRAELVRSELVVSNDGKNEKVIVVGSADLAREDQVGVPGGFAFTFEVPRAGQPSHESGGARVTWAVRAILDRPLRGDVEAVQDVSIHSARG